MTVKKETPAQLKRKIRVLEARLEVEKERTDVAWQGYRKASYELVELRIRQEEAEKALRGER